MPDQTETPTYRAFLLDREGKVFAAVVLDAYSDDEARELGRKQVDGCGVEVWERTRVVAVFPDVQRGGV